ncbi:MAG: amidase family protein, partial [Cyclobacteriaceae bacterium]
DTPGPMTRTITDNAILLSAMSGRDTEDPASDENAANDIAYWKNLDSESLSGKRFGVIKRFLADTVYAATVEKISNAGAVVVEIDPENADMKGFVDLLSADMKIDLPVYLNKYGSKNISYRTVDEIVAFNLTDTVNYIPYGQGRFDHIVESNLTTEEHELLWQTLHQAGIDYFEKPMTANNLDAILSANNWSAGVAAVAQYPCLTIPMGYTSTGTPMGITMIAKPFEEQKLLKLGYAFEQLTNSRKIPVDYQ